MFNRIQKFMYGRYGMDKLGQALAILSIALMLLSSLTRSIILRLLAYIVMGWCLYRIFSKRTVYRANENMKFRQICYDISAFLKRDRKIYRYFKCPSCKKTVKVPKGKGKIEITCPVCRNKFIKKS